MGYPLPAVMLPRESCVQADRFAVGEFDCCGVVEVSLARGAVPVDVVVEFVCCPFAEWAFFACAGYVEAAFFVDPSAGSEGFVPSPYLGGAIVWVVSHVFVSESFCEWFCPCDADLSCVSCVGVCGVDLNFDV